MKCFCLGLRCIQNKITTHILLLQKRKYIKINVEHVIPVRFILSHGSILIILIVYMYKNIKLYSAKVLVGQKFCNRSYLLDKIIYLQITNICQNIYKYLNPVISKILRDNIKDFLFFFKFKYFNISQQNI